MSLRIDGLVGGGYGSFWRFRGRYRVVKGSRGSKKSKTSALWYIFHMMKYSEANLLVARKVFRTLKNSCYAELKWAVYRLGVSDFWAFNESPLEITYLPTGQKIFFRGLDDPMKVNSITAAHGCLCWLWLEEAYEISSEPDFNMLDETIRGAVPPELFKQITITFNPWDERHWLKRRFFDLPPSPDVYAATTTYLCNEFLDDDDLRLFERMRVQNPRRYQVAGLGNWGVSEGAIFENWEESRFDIPQIRGLSGGKAVFGLDFGYTNDPSALFCGVYVADSRELFVFDELYETGLTNFSLFSRISGMGYGGEKIRADSAEPKSIDELRQLGLWRITGARKGPDSIRNGISRLQDLRIIVHPRCVNFIREISTYVWDKDEFSRPRNRPAAGEDHLMDAMRYGMEGVSSGDVFSFD